MYPIGTTFYLKKARFRAVSLELTTLKLFIVLARKAKTFWFLPYPHLAHSPRTFMALTSPHLIPSELVASDIIDLELRLKGTWRGSGETGNEKREGG